MSYAASRVQASRAFRRVVPSMDSHTVVSVGAAAFSTTCYACRTTLQHIFDTLMKLRLQDQYWPCGHQNLCTPKLTTDMQQLTNTVITEPQEL